MLVRSILVDGKLVGGSICLAADLGLGPWDHASFITAMNFDLPVRVLGRLSLVQESDYAIVISIGCYPLIWAIAVVYGFCL